MGGFVDGDGPTTARFQGPQGLAQLGDGTLLISDTGNHSIRMVAPDGTVTTLIGDGRPGLDDATAPPHARVPADDMRLNAPAGIALDRTSGRLLIADVDTMTVRALELELLPRRGAPPSSPPPPLPDLLPLGFCQPRGIVAAPGGGFFVCESGVHRVRQCDRGGRRVTTLAGSGEVGCADGRGRIASFHCPWGICLGPTRVAPSPSPAKGGGGGDDDETAHWRGAFAGSGSGDDDEAARWCGVLYVADKYSHAVRRVSFPDGVVTTVAGGGDNGGPACGWRDGAARAARFANPTAVASASDGCVYVSDSANNAIRAIAPDGRTVATLAAAARPPAAVAGALLSAVGGRGGGGAALPLAPLVLPLLRSPQALHLDEARGRIVIATGHGSHRLLAVTVPTPAQRRSARLAPILRVRALALRGRAVLTAHDEDGATAGGVIAHGPRLRRPCSPSDGASNGECTRNPMRDGVEADEAACRRALQRLVECPIDGIFMLVLEFALL